MEGILIRYEFDGDEAAWRSAVDSFVAGIDADPELRGGFSYSVNVAADGKRRVHVGRWRDPATLETLQGRDYFKTFAAAVKGFAGDTLETVRITQVNATNAAA